MYSNCHLFYSIYTSRPVYSFLYTIINGNVIASFVPKKKRFETLRCKKKFFLCTYATLNPRRPPLPTPLVRNCAHLAWSLHSFFVSTYYVDDPLISPRIGGGVLLSFKVLSCGAYWKAVLKRRMLQFQSQRNYSQ